jgi:hypothetical protein
MEEKKIRKWSGDWTKKKEWLVHVDLIFFFSQEKTKCHCTFIFYFLKKINDVSSTVCVTNNISSATTNNILFICLDFDHINDE